MKRSKKIGTLMHKLLVEKEMNGFSVVELRDAYVLVDGKHVDLDDARRRVYRQILRFIQNKWLYSEGYGRQKRYFQTDLFKSLSTIQMSSPVEGRALSDYSVLGHERNLYKGELEIVLGEIEEYQSLNDRFPELEPKLTPYLEQAKERSANLLGKINVLTNVLKALSVGSQKC